MVKQIVSFECTHRELSFESTHLLQENELSSTMNIKVPINPKISFPKSKSLAYSEKEFERIKALSEKENDLWRVKHSENSVLGRSSRIWTSERKKGLVPFVTSTQEHSVVYFLFASWTKPLEVTH